MDEEKTLVEKLAQTFLQTKPKVEQIHSMGAAGGELLSDGSVYYLCDHRRIRAFHSFARTTDDRVIHTKTAKKVKIHHETLASGLKVTTHHRENGLLLRRELLLHTDGSLTVQLFLEGENGVPVERRCLAPLDLPYPDGTGEGLFLALIRRTPTLRLGDQHVLEICGGPNCTKKWTPVLKNLPENVTVRTVPCMRLCGKGPNIRLDGTLHSGMSEEALRKLLESLRG